MTLCLFVIFCFNWCVFRYNDDTGHFTQVVWAETHQIGCASIYYKVDEGGDERSR